MKNKKLLVINLLTLTAFVAVVITGIYQSELNKDKYGKEEKVEEVDKEEEKGAEEALIITPVEKDELDEPAVKKTTAVGELMRQKSSLFVEAMKEASLLAEKTVDEQVVDESEELSIEDDDAGASTTVSTYPNASTHNQKSPSTHQGNKSNKNENITTSTDNETEKSSGDSDNTNSGTDQETEQGDIGESPSESVEEDQKEEKSGEDAKPTDSENKDDPVKTPPATDDEKEEGSDKEDEKPKEENPGKKANSQQDNKAQENQ